MIDASTSHTLTVTTEGYKMWQIELAPRNLTHNVTMEAPVRLEPVKPEAFKRIGEV